MVGVGDAFVHDVEKMRVFQRCRHALLVVELLVDSLFGRMRSGCDQNVHFEARRKRAEQLDAKTKPNQSRHAVATTKEENKTEISVMAYSETMVTSSSNMASCYLQCGMVGVKLTRT